jgi:hypothetical protein
VSANGALTATAVLWAAWLVVWLVAVLGAKPTQWREPCAALKK